MSEDKTYPKLLPEFKTKWLEALRSGKYNQGKMYLRRYNKFCCLGVACDLIDPTKWKIVSSTEPHILWENKAGLLPDSTKSIMFQDGNIKNFEWDELMEELAGMNDDGKSFLEIADWIEKNL